MTVRTAIRSVHAIETAAPVSVRCRNSDSVFGYTSKVASRMRTCQLCVHHRTAAPPRRHAAALRSRKGGNVSGQATKQHPLTTQLCKMSQMLVR